MERSRVAAGKASLALLVLDGSAPLDAEDEAAIAVVGTRKCTAYGLDVASQLGYELAKQGALVLSGMAKGIDGEALKGALRAGGFTAPFKVYNPKCYGAEGA